MTILNIIDSRKRKYGFRNIVAIIEPTRHDNSCFQADQAGGTDTWMGYDDRTGISVAEAIAWANAHEDEVTLYLWDAETEAQRQPVRLVSKEIFK